MAEPDNPTDMDFADLDPDVLARAEAALADLSHDYLTWAEADIASLRAGLADLDEHPADASAILERLFRLTHDMKGQATTFGYPLVTEIGQRLCRLFEAGQVKADLLLLHVEALAEVVESRLTGDGGDAGRAIIGRLE